MMKKIFFLLFSYSLLTTCLAQNSMNISLLFHWDDTSLVASSAHDNTYNEIWGYTKDGKEYAIIGSTSGTHIFDVTNPTNASEVVFIAGEVQGTTIIHRDYHDYEDYLYIVCDEGPSTLQIADLSYLPDSAPVVYNSSSLFKRSHNIFIDTTYARLYTCGGDQNNGLRVFTLANPENPTELINFQFNTPVHDVYVQNDTAYINDGNDGLFIYDFSDQFNPALIGSLTSYIHQGYNHSGWLHENGKLYALADETHGMKIKLFDVSDFGNITLLDTLHTNINANSIPHNLIFKGDYLHVSYYHDGYYIFDVSDPQNVTVAGFYDTSTETHATNYRGAWGIYPFLPSGNVLVSDMQNGLYVFDVSKATGTNKTTSFLKEPRVFPNPSNSNFQVVIPEYSTSLHYTIYDHVGKKLTENSIASSIEFSFGNELPTGVYYLNLSAKEFNSTLKIVKTH